MGDSLLSVFQDNVIEIPFNRLNSYQQLQRVIQQFWNQWSRSYLHTLQQRFRWKLAQSNITTDALVLLKEDNVPPMRWLSGRVVGVHPGSDGISALNEDFEMNVLLSVGEIHHVPTRQIARELEISQSSAMKVLKTHKFHPYEMPNLQKLTEDDPE
ncbi:hypothetical protein JTB14_017751 [Gonioctena quinquepunctata]|nr:hypothetical protein JTB14_017751 [Gonioctena quinquepunctata]